MEKTDPKKVEMEWAITILYDRRQIVIKYIYGYLVRLLFGQTRFAAARGMHNRNRV